MGGRAGCMGLAGKRLDMPVRQPCILGIDPWLTTAAPLTTAPPSPLLAVCSLQPGGWRGLHSWGIAGAAVGTTSSKPDALLCRRPLPHLYGAHPALCPPFVLTKEFCCGTPQPTPAAAVRCQLRAAASIAPCSPFLSLPAAAVRCQLQKGLQPHLRLEPGPQPEPHLLKGGFHCVN